MARSFITLAGALALSSGAAAAVLPSAPEGQTPFSMSSKPLVSTEALQASINRGNLMKRAAHLYGIANRSTEAWGHPTRIIGSKGHEGTLEYIQESLAALGDYYDVSTQSFHASYGQVFESRLVIGNGVPDSAAVMRMSPPTPKKQPVTGPLVLVANGGCDASDYPADVKGAVALIKRGTCSFDAKSANAGKAGAAAAVIYNNEAGGETTYGTLGQPSDDHVPTWGMNNAEGSHYAKYLEAGTALDVSAYVDSVVNNIKTLNVLAQTRGGDPDHCVMIGGHSDGVGAGPGINDDGTGSITVLEVATQLTKFEVNNCVRFAWWAAEEEGLLGSDYYVSQLSEEESMKIRLFMDYDMLASPNFAYQVYNATNAANPEGSEQLRDLYINWYNEQNLNHTLIAFDGRSDYDAFIRSGIPGGGIATGAEVIKTKEEEAMFGGKAGVAYDYCYHELCDDLSNLAVDAWEINSKLVAHSVATYAVSFDGFPERKSVQSAATAEAYQPKYHGGLVM